MSATQVQELADGCVRFVREAVQLELDYSSDTLPILDHYLLEARKDPKPELRQLIAPAAGAYFGELVRRRLGTWRWYCTGDEFASYRLECERCFLYFHPVALALEALLGGPAEGAGAQLGVLPADRDAVKEALERLGSVRRDDYYRLAVRYEVLEQVMATLVARALQSDEGAVHLGPEVYAAAVDGPAGPAN